MSPDPVQFYHIYAAGGWRAPVYEHLSALRAGKWRGRLLVGVVGPADKRAEAMERLTAWAQPWSAPPELVVEADEGWEQVTLRALHERVRQSAVGQAVGYAHTKGASDASPINQIWRRSMTLHTVQRWANCVEALGRGFDAVGCHWLTPGEFGPAVPSPFFGGNFWWARADYLQTLPPPPTQTRHEAETWVGLGSPKILDLVPGWPSIELCGQALMQPVSRIRLVPDEPA